MTEPAYERLSALDAAFLQLEDTHAHMHVGGIITMDAGPLTLAHGGIDFAHLRGQLESAVLQAPRLRQRIERVPGFGHPVWIDDPHFRLDYHVRHAALPRPGSNAELQRLAGRIFSQPLDQARPLWEMWVVEGLDGNRFALIPKIHHCMMDGIGAVGLIAALAGARRTAVVPADPAPAAKPTRSELWWGEVRHRLAGVQETVRSARGAVDKAREGTSSGAGEIARGLSDALKSGLTPVTSTPINPESLGPHRRFATLRMSLRDVKAIKNQLGGTVNDVVLTVITGAARSYLARRGMNLSEISRFRALVPANLRADIAPSAHSLGNRVAFMLASLPIDEDDPIAQHGRVCAETRQQKESGEVAGSDFLEKLDDGLGLGLVATTFKLAIARRAFNLVVTNVPGPPMSLNLFGAKLLSIHPLVPLFKHQAVGIAIFSYDGSLYWGLNADWDAVPDLPGLVTDIEDAFSRLKDCARLAPRKPGTGYPRHDPVSPAPSSAGWTT